MAPRVYLGNQAILKVDLSNEVDCDMLKHHIEFVKAIKTIKTRAQKRQEREEDLQEAELVPKNLDYFDDGKVKGVVTLTITVQQDIEQKTLIITSGVD